MQLIIIHNNNRPGKNNFSLLRFAVSNRLIAEIIFDRPGKSIAHSDRGNAVIALPEQWQAKTPQLCRKIIYHNGHLRLCLNAAEKCKKTNGRFIISNGGFITATDWHRLNNILADYDADVTAVNVNPALSSYGEKVCITSTNNIAGFRRFYTNSIQPTPAPPDWPHHIFIKYPVLDKVLSDGRLPLSFAEFISRCTAKRLNLCYFNVGGEVLDLNTEAGLLKLLTANLHSTAHRLSLINRRYNNRANCTISDSARIVGRVVLGNNVNVGDNAVIVGPVVLADNVKIGSAAVVKTSIIDSDVSIPKGRFIRNRVIVRTRLKHKLLFQNDNADTGQNNSKAFAVTDTFTNNNFRTWPKLSYVGCWKRIADLTATSAVLLLFAPVIPVIAVVIKLSSPGPVFFRHKRQGLHRKEFYCLKFRTMVDGADKIQEKLRFKNQVDGPQFKAEDDPRVTVVGKFLRDTFIDEIPQFINILLGQMSVVGPRPSPKAENSLCPYWCDARLSVRPGITGLWQVQRTRQPGRDFQEWIYYDTEYVRNLSLSLDISICFRTVKKLVKSFLKQF